MIFEAEIRLNGKTATGIPVPQDVVIALGGKRTPVRVTINGYTYRNTMTPMGGEFLISVSAEVRANAGVSAGDRVEIEVIRDDAPREVEVPADFAAALAADPDAKRRFDALPYSHRREHVTAIEAAKKPETRQRRIEKAMELLNAQG
jgi:hypothetical protein